MHLVTPRTPQEKRRKTAGFSLVELMVVVFIMGLLATLIVVNVAPATDQSRIGKAHSDIAALESALDMYNLDMYGYPSADQGLAALSTAPATATAPIALLAPNAPASTRSSPTKALVPGTAMEDSVNTQSRTP